MKELEKLKKLSACSGALEYVETKKTFTEAWKDCERGNWMLWLIGKTVGKPGDKSRRKLVLAACDCAELSLKYVKKGETRPAEAIKVARAWANGEKVTLDEVKAAADDAYFAAYHAAADAAYAAYAADADDAADAADAADDAARYKVLKQCAEIVRKYYPKPPKF